MLNMNKTKIDFLIGVTNMNKTKIDFLIGVAKALLPQHTPTPRHTPALQFSSHTIALHLTAIGSWL